MKNQDDLQPLPDRAELERTVESLKRDIHKLRLEHDLLKIAAELLKKGLGINLVLLSNREKTLIIDALRQTYAVPENIINRDFHAATPNEKWLSDITEFHIPAGKVTCRP